MIMAWPPTPLMMPLSKSVSTALRMAPTSSIWLGSTPTTLATRSTTKPSGWPTSTITARVASSGSCSGKPNMRRREMMGSTLPRRLARPSKVAGARGTRTTAGRRMISCTGAMSTANTSPPVMKVTNWRVSEARSSRPSSAERASCAPWSIVSFVMADP